MCLGNEDENFKNFFTAFDDSYVDAIKKKFLRIIKSGIASIAPIGQIKRKNDKTKAPRAKWIEEIKKKERCGFKTIKGMQIHENLSSLNSNVF